MCAFLSRLILIPLLLTLLACGTENKSSYKEKELWLSREIKFPHDMIFQVMGCNVDYDIDDCDYKILCYIDTIGCATCKMNMPGWEFFLSQVCSNPDISVKFVMVINTDTETEVIRKARQYRFNYPVVIDKKNTLDSLNNLPTDIERQTFLLDEDNRVVAMGNPLFDQEVRKEYIKHILSDEYNENKGVISIKPEHLAMGIFSGGEVKKTKFRLRNIGNEPINIEEISTSCSCISAWSDQECLQPGGFLDLHVSCSPEADDGYFHRFIYITFDNKDTVTLSISGFSGIEKRQESEKSIIT